MSDIYVVVNGLQIKVINNGHRELHHKPEVVNGLQIKVINNLANFKPVDGEL